jgi:hypothetical protein
MVRGVPECEFVVFFDADGQVGTLELRRLGDSVLNASHLHDVPFGEVIAKARECLAPFHDALAKERVLVNGRAPDFALWAEALRQRPGRRGHSESHTLDLARVARAYADLVAADDPAPLRTLAEHLSLSYQRVRNLVHEARTKEGLLTATKAGRASGRLTAKAERILEGDDSGLR